MSLTDASIRSFFEADDNFQNKGSVVDIFLESPAELITSATSNFGLNRFVMLC